MSTIGTRRPSAKMPLRELLSSATHLPRSKRSSRCARVTSGCATRRSARTSLPTITSPPGAKLTSDRLDRTVSTGCAGLFITSASLQPDLPPHDRAIAYAQDAEHGHIEQPGTLGVIPVLVLRVGRTRDQPVGVDRRRRRREAPPRGRGP